MVMGCSSGESTAGLKGIAMPVSLRDIAKITHRRGVFQHTSLGLMALTNRSSFYTLSCLRHLTLGHLYASTPPAAEHDKEDYGLPGGPKGCWEYLT
jgi:hypothetical protein